MTLVGIVVYAFWTMVPAYVPNNAAVLFGGDRPIDGERTWRGNRVLGDGKTWRGLVAGTLAGAVLAVVLNRLAPLVWNAASFSLPEFPVAAIIALPLGAMAGDIGASLVKRRLDRQRGAAVPGLDQLDFVVGALVLTAVATAVAGPAGWFRATFSVRVIVAILILTPLLHVGTNMVAYATGLKAEPW